VIVARQKEKLKRGNGAAFDPARLKDLPQENETWEADFEALPKPPTQGERHFLGMVVSKKGRCILAEMQVSRPSVNDMVTMLANAMLFPLSGDAHRPSRIYARYYKPWDEVNAHLNDIGIKVSAHTEFPWLYHLFHERLRQKREMRSPGKVELTAEQAKVAEMLPALSKFVQDCGVIEIGDPDGCGFAVRAEDYDGVRVFEDHNLSTLAEALAALEKELGMWFGEKNGNLTSVTKAVSKSSPQ
jgi:hypothetical protein